MIEVPGESLARKEAVVEDRVLVAGKDGLGRAELVVAVAARAILELGRRMFGANELRENDGAREAVETVAVRCNDDAHGGLS